MSLKFLRLFLVFAIANGKGFVAFINTKQKEQTEAQKFGQKVLENVPAAMTIATFLQLNEQVEFFRTNKAIQKLQDMYFQYSGISTMIQPLKIMRRKLAHRGGVFRFASVFVDMRGCMEYDDVNRKWKARLAYGEFGYTRNKPLPGLTAKMEIPGYGTRNLLSERVHIQTASVFYASFEILLFFKFGNSEETRGSLYRFSNVKFQDDRVILEYETPRYVEGKMPTRKNIKPTYGLRRYPGGYVWELDQTKIELSKNGAVFHRQNRRERLEDVKKLLTYKVGAFATFQKD